MKASTELNNILQIAAETGDLINLIKSIEQGADIHADNDGALRYSARNGNLDTVKYLIENGKWSVRCN
jgi:ankyrin repeat protein